MIPPFLRIGQCILADFPPNLLSSIKLPLVPMSGFFDNLDEILQPNMSFEEIAEKYLPKIEKIIENCNSENKHSYTFRLKIYKVAKSKKYFRLRFEFDTWSQDSPPRSGRFWLNPESWEELKKEQSKILIEKIC